MTRRSPLRRPRSGLYTGDLLDRADVPFWFWLYDGPKMADVPREEYRRSHQEARRKVAELYAAGNDDAELRRAQELYVGLTGELAEDEQLWDSPVPDSR